MWKILRIGDEAVGGDEVRLNSTLVAVANDYDLSFPMVLISHTDLLLRCDFFLPSSVCRSFPVAMSKMLMIPSMAPLARYFPSGLWEETGNKRRSDRHQGFLLILLRTKL